MKKFKIKDSEEEISKEEKIDFLYDLLLSNIDNIESEISNLLGVDVTLDVKKQKYYAGTLINVISNDLINGFGKLGKFLFYGINIKGTLTDIQYDYYHQYDGIEIPFDFEYTHPSYNGTNGSNGRYCLSLRIMKNGDIIAKQFREQYFE